LDLLLTQLLNHERLNRLGLQMMSHMMQGSCSYKVQSDQILWDWIAAMKRVWKRCLQNRSSAQRRSLQRTQGGHRRTGRWYPRTSWTLHILYGWIISTDGQMPDWRVELREIKGDITNIECPGNQT
jgi:hypothetical protein